MRAINFVFFAVFLALTLLPLGAKHGHFFPEFPLFGAVTQPVHVELAARSYLDGSFQRAFERVFDADFPLRGPLVRADNELNFKAFGEFTPALRTIRGDDEFLYDQGFIDDYNRRNVVPASALEAKVERLKLLQDYLEARHSALLLVISPSKPLLYPEFLPARFVDQSRLSLPNNYSVFVGLLQKHGVHFIDSQRELRDLKPASAIRFFANSGMHWNSPAACMVTAEISEFIASQLPGSSVLRCGRPVMRGAPTGYDRDVADLANLWHEEALFRPTPYVRPRVKKQRRAHNPNLLFVGSSFVWGILAFAKQRLYTHYSFFYYYNARQDFRGPRTVIDRKQLDWNNDILNREAIVFEVNASVVDEVGWGFLEDAERVIHELEPTVH
jgi:hypothetical protein